LVDSFERRVTSIWFIKNYGMKERERERERQTDRRGGVWMQPHIVLFWHTITFCLITEVSKE
jgi:hypothetical protein